MSMKIFAACLFLQLARLLHLILLIVVVRLIVQDGVSSVQLFSKNQADHLVRKGHF